MTEETDFTPEWGKIDVPNLDDLSYPREVCMKLPEDRQGGYININSHRVYLDQVNIETARSRCVDCHWSGVVVYPRVRDNETEEEARQRLMDRIEKPFKHPCPES